MPENNIIYSVRLSDGRTDTLTQEQYDTIKDRLYADDSGAEVVRTSVYNRDADDMSQSDVFQVRLGDGRTDTLTREQFEQIREPMMRDNPDLEIFQVSDMSDRYWRPKLEEAQAALERFNGEHGSVINKYELYQNAIENNTPSQIAWQAEHEQEYRSLIGQRDALRDAVVNNPIVKRGRRQAQEQAMAARENYLDLASKATTGAERRDYKRAAKLQGDAAELFGAPGQYDKTDKNGFAQYMSDYGKGALNTFSDKDFWTRGLTQIARDIDLHGIRKKVEDAVKAKGAELEERDFDRILSPSEKAQLFSFYNLARAQAERANDLSSAYKAGTSAAESAGFMAEFLLSTGFGNVFGKAILTKTTSAFGHWIGQALMSEKALGRAIEKGITAPIQMSRAAKIATEIIARPMVQGLWHTGTQLSTLSNIASMMNQTNKEGELNSVGRGIWLGFADSLVENWSESFGNTIDFGMEAIGKGLGWAGNKVLGKTTFGQMARYALHSPFAQTLKEAGFNGFFGEMMEEWAGNAVRLATGLMDKDEFKQFASVQQQLEMAASFAPMSLFGLAGNTISAVKYKKEYDKLSPKVKDILLKNNPDATAQAAINELFERKWATSEDIAAGLAPYAQQVLNSGSSTAKADYKTILDFARMAGADAFNEAVNEYQNEQRRGEMQEAIQAQIGRRFWTDIDVMDEKTDEVARTESSVRVVTDIAGNTYFVMSGDDQGVLGVSTVDGTTSLLFNDQIASDNTSSLNDYLQSRVEATDKDAEAKRMYNELQQNLAAVRKRVEENPTFDMGTPEAPKIVTVDPNSATNEGLLGTYKEDGQDVLTFMSWKDVAGYLGMPFEPQTDAQMAEAAAAAQEQAAARKTKYNNIPIGTQITVTMPGAEGDEQVPYRFAKAIYDENEGSVRIYVADENGQIMTDSKGDEVWFPEEMVQGLDAIADQAIQQQNTPAPVETETPPAPVESQAPVARYTNEAGKVNQTAFMKNEPEEWAKWNDERNQDNGEDSMEALGAAIGELDKALAEQEKKRKATSNPDDRDRIKDEIKTLSERRARLDAIYQGYVAQRKAAKEAEDAAKRAEFEAAAAAKKEAEKKAAAKIQDDLKEDASFVELAETYANQPKTYGDKDTYNVGGRKFKGRWVVAEATTPKPSHNPLNDFAPTPGYPIGKAGNSNHYDKDKRAQEITREMSNPFDERAVQEPVVVTRHGIVLSGNGRTQARLLAAQQQTDAEYKEYVREHASKWGLTAEQVDSYANPILYFELEEDVEYTAALFDAFNRSTSKQQSATETAAKVAQMSSEELVMRLDRLFREIGDSIDNLYKNPDKVNELLNMLQAAGIFNANERARYVDEYGNLSGAGEDLVESVLFGTIFDTSDDAVRAAMNDKAVRRAVTFAFPTLVRLRNLNGELSLIGELTEAVSLLSAAKAANGGKAENAVIDYMLQGDLWTGETPIVKATVQLLAHVLNDGKYGSLRNVLNQYIERAEAANYGQAIFTDEGTIEVETKERILRDVLAHNKINIETYGNTAATEQGVPADAAVRSASGEQGSSGAPADGTGAGNPAGVQGEGNPAQEVAPGGPVNILEVAKEQAERIKRLKKRVAKWKKFLGDSFAIAEGIKDIKKIEDASTRQQVLNRQQAEGDVEGWFDTKTGKAVIYLPNIPDEKTLDRKIIHEVLSHKGIRGMLGEERFAQLCDFVWGQMNDEDRSRYLNYPGVFGIKDLQARQRAAADEYLAHESEKRAAIIAAQTIDADFWTKVGEFVKNFINDAIGEDLLMTAGELGEMLKDAANYVRRNSPAAPESEDTGALFSVADKRGLPLEQYNKVIDALFNDPSFNRDEHSRERYNFGETPDWMKTIGLTGDNFSLSFKNIREHYGKDSDHSLTADEWKKLPEAVKTPFLVTKYKGQNDKFRLYTGIVHDGKFVVAGIDVVKVNQGKDAPILEVNRIKTAFGNNGRISPSETIVTYDEAITPEQEALLRGLNYREYPSIQELSASKGSESSSNAQVSDIKNDEQGGNVLFSVGDGWLVGMHNISERKLRSAIRTGGLANPSLAVIDVDNMIHEDYGDISLLAPASLVDTRTGRSAGTYSGDAWTPTYPGVRKQMSDNGWDKFSDQVRVLPEPFSHQVRNDWREYLDDDRMGRSLKWWFLQDTGRNPETVYNTSNLSEEDKELVRSFSGKKIFGTDEDASKAIEMFRRLADPEEVERAGRKIEIKEGKPGRYRDWEIARNEDIDSWGIFTAPVVDFIEKLQRQVRYEGTIAEQSTYQSAEDFVRDNNLDGEFQQWLQDKEKEFGTKEVLFAGWTPDGDRKYVPNTVENASRLMNKEPEQNAYGNGGLSATRSLLLERMDTLEEIRKNRGQLADIRGYASDTPEYEAASSNWFNVIEALADMQKISDNQFSNIDYAEARLQEAIQKRNPIAYLNKEYRYHITEDGEFAEALKASIEEIKALPSKYFETKFNRPVYLNEFAAAVIPTDTAEGVRKELEKAGLPIYEYDSKKEGSRQEAVLQASQVDGVRFSVGDYQSGEAQKQYRQQLENTPEFKEWFKGSKVVDENGNPLVVYRGATFDPLAMADGLGVIKPQAYFSPSEEYARRYGPWTRSYYLNIQNPFDIRNKKDLEIYKKMLPDGYVIAKTGSGAADWAEFGAAIDIDTLMDNHPEYDGIILDEGGDPDGNGGVTSRGVSYIPLRGGAQVKSADANNGQFSPENPDVRFSVITPKQDAEYMQAVEDGDMEKAQQMVDDAAKASGFTVKGYHGTILRKYDTDYMEFPQEKPFTVFHTDNQMGAHFGYSRRQAENRASDLEREDAGWIDEEFIYDTWLKLDNPALIDDIRNFNDFQRVRDSLVENEVITEDEARYVWNNKSITDLLKSKGYDGLVYTNDYEGRGPSYVVFDANQIKSSEPVTVDDEGKVIPLSQRFNEDNEDIRFSVRRYHNFATAQQENKIPGKEYPELEDETVRFSLSKNNRATVEAWLSKRGDLTDEQRRAVVDYLDTLNNPTLQLATAKWFSQGVVRLPEDMDKVEQAVSVAGKAKVDPLQYNSPMELLDAHADFKASEKRIDPADVKTLHKVKEFKEHGIVIYDVEDNEESRQNMRKIINSHFGKEASPWCLLQGDGNGNLTKASAQYWRSYNAYPKQVCFLNGKLLAFSANDTNRVVWWDRQDKPYEGIPVTRKMAGDELGRSATYTLDEDGLLSNPTDIHRGNKQNGTYEAWNDLGVLISRRHYKNGKRDGLQESFYAGGEPYIREECKDGAPVGKYLNWFANGQIHIEYNYSEDGFAEGEQLEYNARGILTLREYKKHGLRDGVQETWNANGVQLLRGEYKDGKKDGVTETWNDNGQQMSYVEYKEGKQEGTSKAWHWNGKLAREAQYHDDHLVGERKTWYESGNIHEISHFDENGELDGTREIYHDFVGREQIAARGNYNHGVRDGLFEKWHDKDILAERVRYSNDHKVGLEEKWYDNGVLGMRTTYDENGVENGVKERWDSGGRLWDRHEVVDGEEGRFLGTYPQESVYGDVKFSVVTDKAELDRLESEPAITLYRAMELIDGQLYPPMSQKIPNSQSDKGKKMQRREGVVPGMWQKSDEDPSKAYQKEEGGPWYYDLKKTKGSDVNGVLYNPYLHLSASPLNDQFSAASTRPNLVTVACEVPISELTSGYKAEKANDSVGAKDWHSGTVTAQLGNGRQVVLSRWAKISRVVPDTEVAAMVAPGIVEKNIYVPVNVVTPSLRAALEARGVKFAEPVAEGDVKFSIQNRVFRAQERRPGESSASYGMRLAYTFDNVYHKGAAGWRTSPIGEDERGDMAYSKTSKKIVIFVRDEMPSVSDMEMLFFHESLHAWIDKLSSEEKQMLLDSYGVAKFAPEESRDGAREAIRNMGYEEDQVPEEYLTYTLSEAMSFGKVNAVRNAISDDGRALIDDILKNIDYNVEQETKRRVQSGSDRIRENDSEEAGERAGVRDSVAGGRGEEGEVRFAVANRNQEIFVSNAERAAESIKMDKATPTQWIAMLEKAGGLKAGEDKWLGLSDWLKASDKKTITKQEILEFIDQNRIRIEEVHYSGDPKERLEEDYREQITNGRTLEQIQGEIYQELNLAGDELEGYDQSEIDAWLMEQMKERYGDDFELGYSILDSEVSYNSDVWNVQSWEETAAPEMEERPINSTRLNYTTVGLDNKREIALTVPTIEPWNQQDNIHFGDAGEGRAIAWARFGDAFVDEEVVVKPEDKAELERLNEKVHDAFVKAGEEPSDENRDAFLAARDERDLFAGRTDARGGTRRRRVLFIDEIQSKRHQEGREKGYAPSKDELTKSLDEFQSFNRKMHEKYGEQTIPSDWDNEDRAKFDELRDKNKELNIAWEKGVKSAPFEKNWHELAMKRMLRLAAEEGYDYVAWTTGDQQAERYSLKTLVSEIAARADGNGNYYVVIEDKQGFELPEFSGSGKKMTANEMVSYFGKDLAIRIMTGADQSRGKEWSGKGYNPEFFTVRGDDLQVGGEGMKGFYDDILVRFVNKYAKKWGTSVKDDLVTLSGGALIEAHILPVTNEMKDSVMEGQVMFSVRAAADARRDGIGAVIGKENVSDFYMGLYGAMTPEMRKDVVEKTMGSSLNFVDALQEYVSNVAAKGYQNDDTGILLVAESLLNYYSDETINPYAAQYILWRGTRGVNEDDLLDVAHDQFMWNYLKIEDYPDNPDDTPDGPGKSSIEAAREETDTNPSDAQKEAENYKHGHVSIDGYNISLENPKGSVRSGKDASGKEWSVTMNNDYGYIRMTEGTDGDHIDVFLSDNPEQGNVYVVDQVDPKSGEFDEHKVMYGFNSEDEAREAYLANYSEGWKGLGAITGVTKNEFKKWIESSHRKTKPFADYKSVRFSVSYSMNEADKEAEAAVDEASDELKKGRKEIKDLLTMAKAMGLQKEYDKKTVEAVTNLAKQLLKDQYIDQLSRREVSRLLGIVRTSVGRAPKTVKKNADAIVEMVIENLLRREREGLKRLTSNTGSKTNATGVEVQGSLDVQGQKIMKAYREGIKMEVGKVDDGDDANTLYGMRARLQSRLSSKDDAVRKEAEAEDQGLALAIEYKEGIKALQDEEKSLQEDIKDAAAALHDKDLSKTDYEEFVRATEDAIRENHIEQVEAHREFRTKMQGVLSGSADAKKSFMEREKERVENIHHLANSDMQGRSASKEKRPGFWDKLANSPIVRFFAAPLATFDQMLRLFGEKSINGEGYLYNKFMRGWLEASERAYIGQRDAKAELDRKASEVFGRDMLWSDIYDEEHKMPTVTVKWWDDGKMTEHELSQGQLLYIYMVNKMADGRMKLRKMGIDEETVEAIKGQMDKRFLELADWLQDEYLVNLRNKYNAVHERLFGASMAAIENYFPLKINKRDLNRNEDIAAPDYESLPSTTTGSIIKRRRNSKALDLLNADAFSVVIEHIDQMEQWAAFAEFNKDVNALLSYKRFRNQVQNMASVYGSGTTLWHNFKDVMRIAGNAYHPQVGRNQLDTAAVNLAKGVTSAKISFRMYTALKQFLSLPAFVADANVGYLAKNMVTPWKAWNWAMENLPVFEKRWKSRIAGDTRLMSTEADWKMFRTKMYDTLSRLGMTPNAFVDAVTVAIGARSMYETRYARYIKEGFSEEEADKKAKQDATILYNETQQSNENAFVSAAQLDRTVFSTAITVFRNSSMGFQRQVHDAVRNLGKHFKKGYKEQSIEFMTKQLVREGLSEEQAATAAERRYNRSIMHDSVRLATFGFLVEFAWNLGGSIAYLLFGDDDDEKEKMLMEAFKHALIGGSMEGLAGGNVMSDALNMVAKGENLRNYDPTLLPIISDMKRTYAMMSYDPVAGVNELVNLGVQAGIGVNPQTITDAVVAVIDACNGDLETSKEAMLLIMRVLQVPQSQIDQIYIDELGVKAATAKRMSPKQMAKRYADYKLKRNAPLTGWAYPEELEEKRRKAYEKSFNKKVKERKDKK